MEEKNGSILQVETDSAMTVLGLKRKIIRDHQCSSRKAEIIEFEA